MQFQIQLAVEDRCLAAGIVHDILAHAIEQLIRSTEIDFRRTGEIMVASDTRGHLTRGTAAAIAETVEQDALRERSLSRKLRCEYMSSRMLIDEQ